ncbi:hypothetical protein LPJ57_005133 [Coemansia sp. RSA 486]|nr:hypothetical protein LPJ57_005133 [Coemansia sp. RSA 486]
MFNRGSTYHVVDTNNPAVRYEFEANLKRYVLGFLGTKIKTIEDFIEEEKSLHRRRPSAERDAEFQLRDSQGVPLEESEEFMLEIYDSERDNDNDKEDDYETEFGYIEAFKLTSDSYSLHGSMGHGATFGFKVVDKIAYLTHNGGYACMGTDEFELQTVVEPGIPTKEGRIQIHYAEDGNVLLSQWNGDVYFYCEWIKSSLGILSTDCSEEDIRWAKPLKLVIKRLYKPNPTGKDVRQRRLLREAQLRRLQREQLFMGKRLRFRTPQESETESEFEFTPSDTTNIIRGLKSAKHEERMEALKNLSAKLEQPSENLRGFVLDGACIELLVGFLAGTDSEEKLQSLWCLTNITGFEGRLAEQVLPATPYLVSLLDSHDMELKDQAAWTLGNLASEGPNIREHLYANGVLKPLVELAGTEDRTLLQTVCFALSNMARKPSTYFDQMFDMGLPQVIAKQMQRFRGDVDCVRELAWVCAYLAAASSEQQVDVILETGAVDVILESALMAVDQDGSAAQTSGLLIPAIRTLGNIAAGTDSQTRTLVSKPGFIRLLVRCIESTSSRAVEKESLWVLSSITACCKTDVDAVVNAGVVPDLVRIIEKQNFDLKKEAAYSLLNIAIVGQRIGDLPNEQLVKEFVEFVRSADEELVRMGVQFLSLLFEQLPGELGVEMLRKVEGGVDALETLIAVTEDDDIRATVSALIDQYYGE